MNKEEYTEHVYTQVETQKLIWMAKEIIRNLSLRADPIEVASSLLVAMGMIWQLQNTKHVSKDIMWDLLKDNKHLFELGISTVVERVSDGH